MNPELETCHSPQMNELFAALCKAQVIMKPAIFNKTNPHLKNRYADFTSCMDACRQPLASNGLALLQFTETENGEIFLCTMLGHTSGQWIKSKFPLITAKKDSQGYGAAMTYAKRYTLSSMIGLVSDDDDDDGETSVGRGNCSNKPVQQEKATPPAPQEKKMISAHQILQIDELLKKCPGDFIVNVTSYVAKNFGSFEKIDDKSFASIVNRIQSKIEEMEKATLEVVNAA